VEGEWTAVLNEGALSCLVRRFVLFQGMTLRYWMEFLGEGDTEKFGFGSCFVRTALYKYWSWGICWEVNLSFCSELDGE
jgi:hypothetical protein